MICSLPEVIGAMRWAGHVARVGGKGIRGLMGKPERKGPLGRPRREWEGNIAMDLEEMDFEGVGLDLAVGGKSAGSWERCN